MKRLLLSLLLLASLSPLAPAADKMKEFVMKPGETVYARFEVNPKKIKLIAVSREPDPQAQAIFSLTRDEAKSTLVLRVENKLPKDLAYEAEIRSHTLNLRSRVPVTPVVAGKLAFESMPGAVEELTAFDFSYARYKPAPETPRQ